MVYKIKTMKFKTKLAFLCVVWVISVLCAVFGAATISLAFVVSSTPYSVEENPVIDQIWDDLGSFIGYQTPDKNGAPIWGNVTKVDMEYYFNYSGMKNKTTELSVLFNERENGAVSYDYFSNKLSLHFYNGTQFDVHSSTQTLDIDLTNNEFRLFYSRIEEQTLNKEIYILNSTTETSTLKSTMKSQYFAVTYRSLVETGIQMGYEILGSFPKVFLDIGLNFLVFVALGGGIAMGTAFIFAILQRTRLGGGSTKWTYLLLRLLRGRFGRVVSKIPFFDFGGDWYIEEGLVNDINLSTTRSTFSELFSERWYDLLVFPPLLASIIINLLLLRIPFEDKGAALLTTPFVAPVVLVFLVLYYPIIWSFNEGGFKKIELGPQGDIISVKPLGNIIRDGLGIIVGFSGIVSVSSFGVDVVRSFAYDQTAQGNVVFAGIAFDWFGLLLLILMAVGIFLILLSSSIVGASLIGLQYLQNNHVSNIKYLRQRSSEKKLVSNFGSLHYQFNPEPKEIIISEE
jgi:hypothetical protein